MSNKNYENKHKAKYLMNKTNQKCKTSSKSKIFKPQKNHTIKKLMS